jgi:hypothetical protein
MDSKRVMGEFHSMSLRIVTVLSLMVTIAQT